MTYEKMSDKEAFAYWPQYLSPGSTFRSIIHVNGTKRGAYLDNNAGVVVSTPTYVLDDIITGLLKIERDFAKKERAAKKKEIKVESIETDTEKIKEHLKKNWSTISNTAVKEDVCAAAQMPLKYNLTLKIADDKTGLSFYFKPSIESNMAKSKYCVYATIESDEETDYSAHRSTDVTISRGITVKTLAEAMEVLDELILEQIAMLSIHAGWYALEKKFETPEKADK